MEWGKAGRDGRWDGRIVIYSHQELPDEHRLGGWLIVLCPAQTVPTSSYTIRSERVRINDKSLLYIINQRSCRLLPTGVILSLEVLSRAE